MAIFFNQRKTRGFNYRPRFYDPEAEAREERKKVVLGERYRSPRNEDYAPGAFIREHVAARRGNVADTIRKRRRKVMSVPVLVVILAAILFFAWMLYFK